MDFFEQQDRARRNSSRLVILLVLAVITLIGTTTLVIAIAWQVYQYGNYSLQALSHELLVSVALVVVGVVLLGWAFKAMQLRAGGKVVAERLGGRLLNLQPQGVHEQRVLNVVEEMALAAGTPVPPVYLLEEPSINAFAAGLRPENAVIGVTRGAIEKLSRDELQGVIAHEFSHILHGDMRLNTRLVAVLHGILLLGLIGELVLRGGSHTRHAPRSSSNDKGKGNAVALVMVVGLALLIIGYAGTFFGNLIKAAVSRQREFLADASAVQYTRNPDGIAGALKKLGGGSQIEAGHAAEYSHMYFGQGLALSKMMATHPPLEERIRRIDPSWDGVVLGNEVFERPARAAARSHEEIAGFSAAAAGIAIASIGEPQPLHIEEARESLAQIDDRLRNAAHDPHGALAILYGLLLGRDADTRQQRMSWMQANLPPLLSDRLQELGTALERLPAGRRLPLLELAIPALKQLEPQDFVSLKRDIGTLLISTKQLDLIEWALLRIVERNLGMQRPVQGRLPLAALGNESGVLLVALSRAGNTSEEAATEAFQAAWATLPFTARVFAEQPQAGITALNDALNRLNQMRPLQKPQLLKAMARCIEHDGRISASEAELMRAVADTLDCPMPPLLSDAQA
ncbi:Zn-dependent protease with chaperone function [Pseudomonas sp. BIGb0408]|uniref:Zn-dependent protease with chaperone function n=1 Tax=Phytopseudomonas flavescens TaxID=29435 RepID=A0A7Z0BQ89_9GAMM|nr:MULTISPECIES: M48 family metallopeptidase [Pseudomonas]MCW2291760.1 Zn-dependent protease with chaperone function [Pseudomonas sp. BIGb0408]NYH73669.1 Zn-dependent protease with chaperone function [Pseudomonas flavescens]